MLDLPNFSPEVSNALQKLLEAYARGPEGLTVAQVYEKYLDWCKHNHPPRTLEIAEKHCSRFLGSLTPGLKAVDLKPYHVLEWIEKHGNWGPNTRRAAISAVTIPINWAARLGYPGVPRISVKRPAPKKRKGKLTPALWEKLLGLLSVADPFRDMLTFAWETGTRPQETRLIEAKHLRWEQHRVEIPPDQEIANKGKRRWRMVYLSPAAEAIVKPLADRYSTGVLFRNWDGVAWTPNAVCCRFGRLQTKLGVRLRATDFRHAFATRLLQEHDVATVAALMGHVDGRMVLQVYEELSTDGEHLQNAVRKKQTPLSRDPDAGNGVVGRGDHSEASG